MHRITAITNSELALREKNHFLRGFAINGKPQPLGFRSQKTPLIKKKPVSILKSEEKLSKLNSLLLNEYGIEKKNHIEISQDLMSLFESTHS